MTEPTSPEEPTPELTPAVMGAAQTRADLHDAMFEAEDAIAAAAPGRFQEWADAVQTALAHLHAAFHAHIEVAESPDGLYEEVLEREPRLRSQVTRLKEEHPIILAAIHEPFERLSNRGEEYIPAEDVRREVTVVLGRITRHRQRGADLVWEAYYVDLGGLD